MDGLGILSNRAVLAATGLLVLAIGGIAVSNADMQGKDTRPNIVVIVSESTRADHLPCYGHTKNTTPNLCQLANDGILFENAYSQGPWTLSSLPQLLTGQPPTAVAKNNETWKTKLSNDTTTYP